MCLTKAKLITLICIKKSVADCLVSVRTLSEDFNAKTLLNILRSCRRRWPVQALIIRSLFMSVCHRHTPGHFLVASFLVREWEPECVCQSKFPRGEKRRKDRKDCWESYMFVGSFSIERPAFSFFFFSFCNRTSCPATMTFCSWSLFSCNSKMQACLIESRFKFRRRFWTSS